MSTPSSGTATTSKGAPLEVVVVPDDGDPFPQTCWGSCRLRRWSANGVLQNVLRRRMIRPLPIAKNGHAFRAGPLGRGRRWSSRPGGRPRAPLASKNTASRHRRERRVRFSRKHCADGHEGGVLVLPSTLMCSSAAHQCGEEHSVVRNDQFGTPAVLVRWRGTEGHIRPIDVRPVPWDERRLDGCRARPALFAARPDWSATAPVVRNDEPDRSETSEERATMCGGASTKDSLALTTTQHRKPPCSLLYCSTSSGTANRYTRRDDDVVLVSTSRGRSLAEPPHSWSLFLLMF